MTLSISNNYLEIVFDTRTVSMTVHEIILDGTVIVTGADGQAYFLTASEFTSPTFASNSDLYDYIQTNAL